jgi:hypothetical protein
VRELPGKFPYLAEHIEQHTTKAKRNDVREFDFGLDLILDGLEKVRVRRNRRASPQRLIAKRSSHP